MSGVDDLNGDGNDDIIAGSPTDDPGGLNNGFFESPGSEHPGGAQFCTADGSVHFISENVDAVLFLFLGGRADGEVAQMP